MLYSKTVDCIKRLGLLSLLVSVMYACQSSKNVEKKAEFQIHIIDSFLYPNQQITPHTIEIFTEKYPIFSHNFFQYILHIDSQNLLSELTLNQLNRYRQLFAPVSDSVHQYIAGLQKEQEKIGQFLLAYKKQFEDTGFNIPPIFAYTAPVDAPGVALFDNSIGINLTLFAGEKFPLYKASGFQTAFPRYLHHRLNRSYIPFLILEQILTDRNPPKRKVTNLLEKMVQKGMHWYVIHKLSGGSEATLQYICGYTTSQMKWCLENEAAIWKFIQTMVKDLYTNNPTIVRNYLGESPHTNGMPEQAPGNIGPWIGMRIVDEFMQLHEGNISLKDLFYINPNQLFRQSSYNPQ